MDNALLANLRGHWASSALIIYEIIITLDREINLVWTGNWTILKTVYFAARYIGLSTSLFSSIVGVLPLSNAFCAIQNAIELTLLCITLIASDTLLLLRVSALCADRSSGVWGISYFYIIRRLLWGVYFVIIIAAVVIISVEYVVSLQNVGPPDKINFGCFTVNGPPDFAFFVLIVAVWLFDGLLFGVTLLKLAPTWRTTSPSKLPSILFRDGSLYFALNFIIYGMICISIAFVRRNPYSGGFLAPWTIVIPPIYSCRLFLNIKRYGASVKTSDLKPVKNGAAPRSEALLAELESGNAVSRGETDSWDI